jgi:hypothetical protein
MPNNREFPPPRNYMLNTLKDLLDARHHYHVHLSHLNHVVGTAVGRYLIHKDDWYAKNSDPRPKNVPLVKEPRTLFNSVVTDWSWPCILVFVNEWAQRSAFGAAPDTMVPRAVFLPDGRVIPTCVVLVKEEKYPSATEYHLSFPRSRMGGGFLTQALVQGREHIGSVGCLVTDGDLVYALTNRHVTGSGGREIFTTMHGRRRRVGTSDARHLVSKPFIEMYQGWAGSNVQLNIDAGLIRLDDLADWTTQVAGMGPLDEWLNLTTDSLTLDMVDQEVRAFGAASGELKGKVAALFYRYSTAGGVDYVTDFLIRPRSLDEPGTLHGDSGTLWFWEQKMDGDGVRLRPFAMQWGGHTWVDDSGSCNRTGRFALASSLSNVCRELGVTILRDWNSGLPEYWGDVGHYTIGFFACDGLGGKIGQLMKANQLNVSYPYDSIQSKTKIKEKGTDEFVPLADVPDRLWAHGKLLRGGADGANHFADMDQPDPAQGNKTLLQLCEDPANVDPDFWIRYYNEVADRGRGLLPFRVWQFFDEMVDAASNKDVARFVCAAGICAHYVGDACQPLHCSYLHDGYTDGRGKGVHSAYEAKMLTNNSAALLSMLTRELAKGKGAIEPPASGHQAAVVTVDLMRRTFKTIQPSEIVDAYIANADLWELLGERTVKVMADGVRTLQAVWEGAWAAGGGDKIASAKLVEVDHADLAGLYLKKTWMPSKSLKTIKPVLKLTGSTP